MQPMRLDPDFVKAVYLGIDLSLRYAIPCLVLAIMNIYLVVRVRKANQRHSEIAGTSRSSLLRLPVLRSVVGIITVFLGCHTGGFGLFVMEVYRILENSQGAGFRTSINVFMGEELATRGLEMKCSAFLLVAVNSTINILLYCLFLPSFKEKWKALFASVLKGTRASETDESPDIVPLDDVS